MTDPVVDPVGVAGELTQADVEQYTGGRLSASDPETQRMLNAALVAARNDIGWHVSPVLTDVTLTLNGPGSRKLRLPTKKIVTVSAITDNGKTLDPATDVIVDAEVPWLLHRRHGCWSWCPSAISITLDHGFTVDEAADWRQAILSMVDQMVSLVSSGRPDADLESKQVDDVVYRWGAAQALPGAAPILDKYRLMWGWA